MSLRLVIELLQRRVGGPSEVLVAAGHGRSYGNCSQVMFRELPGIKSSGLWNYLEQSKLNEGPVYALLTDVGNDIPYGFSPKQILTWVGQCVRRLQMLTPHIVVTNIPITSIEAMPEWRYKIFRPILFPYCQLSKNEIDERARMVHFGLVEMAAGSNFSLFESSADWFGVDAIHVHYWRRELYYQKVLGYFPESHNIRRFATKCPSKFLGWKQRPCFAHKRVFGVDKCRRQPSGQLQNGTYISLY